jgi:hypothetical protein
MWILPKKGYEYNMGSRVRKSKRSLIDEEFRPNLEKDTTEERLDEMLENVSLKNVPLDEREKEAEKPLYLKRYK